MTTRRGSQYFIQSDEGGLRSRNDFTKWKRKAKIPSGTESTQRSAISQRQVPKAHIISKPELELSVSNSNRNKSHSEGSNRHIHEPLQAVLHGLQGKELGNVATNTPRSDELLHIIKMFLKEEEIVKHSNGCNPLSSKPQVKKIKDWHNKKREESKKEAPVAFTRKPQARQTPQQGKRNNKNNWRKSYSPSYSIPIIQKDSMYNVFNMARTLMEFNDKEERRMRQPHFPKKQLCLLIL
ncbi:hypothetical protein O181_043779 [Austropuccinia psidii MF-1]|uniref:Uncharacterized protein n=1 Tax=Austropuccinia psidii MF-1 TaxID=1389203 RepID=A0A9Q3DIR2_9BASI|nr:hypothetical protein [Austropuccinia psidii MF-1]